MCIYMKIYIVIRWRYTSQIYNNNDNNNDDSDNNDDGDKNDDSDDNGKNRASTVSWDRLSKPFSEAVTPAKSIRRK
jgi:hypothetical protein